MPFISGGVTMKVLSQITICAVGVLPFVLACKAEDLIVEPDGTSPPSLASGGNPAWPKPSPVEGVNSSATDQQPALSKDGLSLYFASNRLGGEGSFDIWVAQRECSEGCPWSEPKPLAVVNGSFLDASPTLSRDEHQLFFSSQRSHSHCSPSTTPLCNNRDLWVSYREDVHDDFGWGEAVNLGDAINSPDEEIAPSYFENEEAGIPQLFFNRGAVGGDIYVSELVNGAWAKPTYVRELNIPDPVADQRPSISHNGLEIYFWSDRDGTPRLWLATRESISSPWSAPFPLEFADDVNAQAIMPFIHSHGRTETLLFVRPFGLASRDLWISQRMRDSGLKDEP
jgi:hypothetical protein